MLFLAVVGELCVPKSSGSAACATDVEIANAICDLASDFLCGEWGVSSCRVLEAQINPDAVVSIKGRNNVLIPKK